MANFKNTVTPATKKPVKQAVENSLPVKFAGAEIECVVCYPNFVEKDPQSEKYAALLLITDPDAKETLKAMVAQSCLETFRTEQLPSGAHNPLRDSNERNASGEFAFKHPAFRDDGAMVIRAKTGYAPNCVWGPNETPIDGGEITGGDNCVVQVSTYGFANQSRGVAFSLGRVWLISKGTQKIERGAGAGMNVKRLDRSKLRFSDGGGDLEAA